MVLPRKKNIIPCCMLKKTTFKPCYKPRRHLKQPLNGTVMTRVKQSSTV